MRSGLLLAACVAAVLGATLASEEGATNEAGIEEADPIYKWNLMSMMEGAGLGGTRRIIDVGLRWKYESAHATDKMSTPRISVGHEKKASSLVHVESATGKKSALFTGSDDVEVEINSRSKAPILAMKSGKQRWDVSVPDAEAFHVGKNGLKPTLKLADGKLGVATDGSPKASLHIQSNTKGDHLLFQGNYDGKTDAMMDSIITLESSQDYRGRGVFMPHRGGGNAGASTAWFAGVPQGGNGFQVGSSASHMTESTSGPYTKKQAHMFITNGGKVGFGHTNPEGQVDIQLLAGNAKDADRALNIRGGSVNLDYGQGINSGRIGLLSSEKNTITVGSAKKTQEREIRLQTDAKKYVTISRYNAFVGIGGVTNPSVPLEVKGNVKVGGGHLSISSEPKPQEQTVVLNSASTIPSALGFRQADKPYMTLSAGKSGGTIELANGAALTVANGKMGVGTDPTELFHVKGGDVLFDGSTSLYFKSKVSGTRIFEKDGLHISGGLSSKISFEDSDVIISNAGSNSKIDIRSEPTKEAAVMLTSGSDDWKIGTTMAGAGSLLFRHKGVQAALTRTGSLGVGVEKPLEALHVSGSAFLESKTKAVFSTMKSAAETQAAGVKLQSGVQVWKMHTTGAGNTDVLPGSLEFSTAAKTHVVISKAGSLGVGTGTPLAGTALHVRGPSMYDVGSGKGKVVISTPNSNPGMSFFDNQGYRRMDLEATSSGISFTSAAGNFGIGIQKAKAKLHVYDAKSTSVMLSRSGKVASEAYLTYAGPYLKVGTASADGVQLDVNKKAKMTLHPSGTVGIDNTTPKSTFQVGKATHLYQAGSNAVFAGNAFFDGSKFKYTGSAAAGAVQISSEGNVGFYTAGSGSADMEITEFGKARMIVTPAGLVGVGTETPETSLHLATGADANLKQHGMLMVGASKQALNMVFDAKSIVARRNGSPSTLRLNPDGGDVTLFEDAGKAGAKITFGADGNVGIGPAKAFAKLHVSEGPGKFATIAVGESNAGVGVIRYKESKMTLGFSRSAAGGNNKEEAITVMKGGNVGIGNGQPKAKLHVEGDVLVKGKLNVGGKQIVAMMEDMMKENKRLSRELTAAKEMMTSMGENMKRMMSEMSEMRSAQ